MRTGTKVGLSGCAAGFAVAIYFTASPILSALAPRGSISVSNVGAMIGISFCAAGTLLGIYYSRKGCANA